MACAILLRMAEVADGSKTMAIRFWDFVNGPVRLTLSGAGHGGRGIASERLPEGPVTRAVARGLSRKGEHRGSESI
jgi:hypothetical protein